MEDFTTYRRNIILLGITGVLIVAALVLYSKNSSTPVQMIDPDSGQQVYKTSEIIDRGVSSQTGYRPVLSTDQKIFSLGMRDNEYETIVRGLDEYTKKKYGDKKVVLYAINSESVKYDEPSKTFSFKMREGDPGSSLYLNATIERVKFNVLKVSFIHEDETLYDQQLKINTKL